ncbi:MAG: GNAT family N-acetyltransferase [Gammaproteobacteria bacterium]|nr:GNAT family N-acetyltransferase [Gammaproteobacteria bacterium]
MNQNLRFTILESLAQVTPASWNRLVDGDNPFLRHEFLYALERSGCTTAATGWQPRHLLVERDGKLAAAVPLYSKRHSYGEYVFDWAWADAYQRAGLSYYPKLVAAVPFTPVSGPRILTANELGPDAALIPAIRDAVIDLATDEGASSAHWLFPDKNQANGLTTQGWLHRTGCQFHWHNPGYANFDHFIEGFSAKKRKNVRRERRRIAEAEIEIEALTGDALKQDHWHYFHRCYQNTIAGHGAIAYLNGEFFSLLGQEMAESAVLFIASRGNTPVASALCLRGSNSLYGRYWGATEYQDNLHFELCYYAPIEYCIREGLARFEAGAQGEHKLSRGFLPSETHSVHWIADPRFADAVDDYLRHERGSVDRQIELLNQHSPFRNQ